MDLDTRLYNESNYTVESEFWKALWPYFLVGKYFATFPFSRRARYRLSFRWTSIATIYTLFVLLHKVIKVIMVGKHFVVDMFNKKSSINTTLLIMNLFFLSHSTLITILILVNAKDIQKMMTYCYEVEKRLVKYKGSDKGVVKKCWIITVCYHTCSLGNLMLFMVAVGVRTGSTSAKEYFENLAILLGIDGIFPLPLTAFISLYMEAFLQVCWVYAEGLLIIISIVITRYYQRLNEFLEKFQTTVPTTTQLEQIRMDHQLINSMVRKVNEATSSLYLVSILCDACYTLIRIRLTHREGRQGNKTFLGHFESAYGILFVLGRALVSAYFASRLSEEAQKPINVLPRWPIGNANMSVDLVWTRFWHQLHSAPAAISVGGFFVFTKSFICTFVSVLVTYEIFIIQLLG